MSNYIPPKGSLVAHDFAATGYTPPPGNIVAFEFDPPRERPPCYLWAPVTDGMVVVDDFQDWIDLPDSSVVVDYDNCLICYEWIEQPGNAVVIDGFATWVEQLGHEVVIAFDDCDAVLSPVNLGYVYNFTGEVGDYTLSTTIGLPLDIGTSETFLFDIQTNPVVDLGIVQFVAGESGQTTLNGDSVFVPFAYTGEYARATLTTYPAITLGLVRGYTGENAQVVLQTFSRFTVDAFTGEYTFVDLDTTPNPGIPLDMATGESLDPSLHVPVGFRALGYTGENARVSLSTTEALTVTFHTGEVFYADVQENIPWSPTLDFYSSESGTATLRTEATFRVAFDAGESLSVVFEDLGPPLFAGDIYYGEYATVALSASQQIGQFNFYTGEAASITAIDTAEFFDFATGESIATVLSTTTVIEAVGQDGTALQFSLDTRPPEPIGVFRFYDGDALDVLVSTLYAVILTPNVITAVQNFDCDFGGSSNFDLGYKDCCPGYDGPEIIELNHMPPTGIQYGGDRTVVYADLSTRPRLSLDLHDGYNLGYSEPNWLGTINFRDGTSAETSRWFESDKLDILLCTGNFIPDPDYINVELVSVYGDCHADYMYTGEKVECELSVTVGARALPATGEWMSFGITLEPAWDIRFYTGESVKVESMPDMRARVGESMSLSFYEEPWNMYTGESMSFDIKTVYDVEFMEMGCLDNAFVPSDENGDPDWENFRPLPTELDQYVRSILARCF